MKPTLPPAKVVVIIVRQSLTPGIRTKMTKDANVPANQDLNNARFVSSTPLW